MADQTSGCPQTAALPQLAELAAKNDGGTDRPERNLIRP
jgi:hypothetical protein